MEADDILRTRSLINRRLYQQRIADAAEEQLERSQPTSYLNFDSTGLARLQDISGNIIYGAAQTNGAISIGESIRLRRGGVLARYDEMPTRKQQQIVNITPTTTMNFVALLSTGDVNTSIGLEYNGSLTGKILVGLDSRTISISYQGGGLGGDILTVTYGSSFSLTTEPTAGGYKYNFEIQYNPDDSADGYLHFALTLGSPTSGMGVSALSNAIYYISDGKQIQRLNYETAYTVNSTNFFLALPSVVGSQIYVTFKQGFSIGALYYNQITIFEINRQTLQQESMQVFQYAGEDFITLPDNQKSLDWRQSSTLSFLPNPPLDSVACISSYRDNPFVHLDQTQGIINYENANQYSVSLTTTKRVFFQSSNFLSNPNSCTTNFKNQAITLNTTPQIATRAQYCTLVGMCIY